MFTGGVRVTVLNVEAREFWSQSGDPPWAGTAPAAAAVGTAPTAAAMAGQNTRYPKPEPEKPEPEPEKPEPEKPEP